MKIVKSAVISTDHRDYPKVIKKIFIILVCAGILICSFLIFCRVANRNPLHNAISSSFNARLEIPEKLKVWEEILGPPKVKYSIFFYWPNHGIAAIAHPHYNAQHRKLSQEEWTLTSIVVPFNKQMVLFPIDREDTVEFKTIDTIRINNKPIAKLSEQELAKMFSSIKKKEELYHDQEYEVIELSNWKNWFCFYPTYVYINKAGNIEALELKPINIFEWYD